MRKATRYTRSTALPAIAAVLAFTSTHALAQEAPAQPQPTTSDPAPAVSAQPAPTLDAPAATDPAVAPEVPPAKVKHTTVTTRTTTRHAAPVAAHAVAQRTTTTTTKRTAAPAPAAAAALASPAPAATTSTSTEVKIKPIVDTTKPANAAPATAAAKPASGSGNDTMLELGGGALAVLALGAGAFALSRRRRHEGEVVEETYEPETAVAAEPEVMPRHDRVYEEQPTIVGPAASAFAWGNREQPATERAEDDGSDRKPGESWVERAYRGPSPANPSVSLRNRLKRAAFFDKREREVAAGKAEPVDTDAGLPDAMVEEQERELA